MAKKRNSGVHLEWTGDGPIELGRLLKTLERKTSGKIIRKALRDSAKEMKVKIVAATPVDTGKLKMAMARERIHSAKRKKHQAGMLVKLPTRDKLGIDAKERWYYPAFIEYGAKAHGIPARPWIRQTFAANAQAAVTAIAASIGRQIHAAAKEKSAGANDGD